MNPQRHGKNIEEGHTFEICKAWACADSDATILLRGFEGAIKTVCRTGYVEQRSPEAI
jgi:hypothetical protein